MKKINIEILGNSIKAELNATAIAKKIFHPLPIESIINRWGDDKYFGIAVDCEFEGDTETVKERALAFCPPENTFRFFLGPTSINTDGRPRDGLPVIIIGRVSKKSDFTTLENTSNRQLINLSR